MKNNQMKYIAVYQNWMPLFRRMATGTEVADFFDAMFKYVNERVGPQGLNDLGQMAFGFIQPFLDDSLERWNRKAAINQRNGRKGAQMRWDAVRAHKREILDSDTATG